MNVCYLKAACFETSEKWIPTTHTDRYRQLLQYDGMHL